MKFIILSLFIIIFTPLIVIAHGGSHTTTDSATQSGPSLSLEQIYGITVLITIIFGLVLSKVIKIKNTRIVYIMILSAIAFLSVDYLYLKTQVYNK